MFTAFLIGVLLLLMSHILIEPAPQPEAEMQIEQKNKEEKESSIEKELEKRLESVFSNMEGVGQVKVMVTVKNTKASVLAKEQRKEYSLSEEGEKKHKHKRKKIQL